MKSDPQLARSPFARDSFFFSPAIRLDIRIAFISCIEMRQDTFGNVPRPRHQESRQRIIASDANERRLHSVGYPLVMCWTLSVYMYLYL